MRVQQYPHYLFSVNASGDSVQDENGNWSDAPATNVFISKCREETDGKGTEIQVAGGTFHKVTSLVQLPEGTKKVEIGSTVFIANNADGTEVRIQGVVLKYDVGQLHNRLWL
jgi:hypothetical protein